MIFLWMFESLKTHLNINTVTSWIIETFLSDVFDELGAQTSTRLVNCTCGSWRPQWPASIWWVNPGHSNKYQETSINTNNSWCFLILIMVYWCLLMFNKPMNSQFNSSPKAKTKSLFLAKGRDQNMSPRWTRVVSERGLPSTWEDMSPCGPKYFLLRPSFSRCENIETVAPNSPGGPSFHLPMGWSNPASISQQKCGNLGYPIL